WAGSSPLPTSVSARSRAATAARPGRSLPAAKAAPTPGRRRRPLLELKADATSRQPVGPGHRPGVLRPGRPAALRRAGLRPRRPRGPALAADRQARAGIRTADAAPARPAVLVAGTARPALPAQRLGQLVPGLPRRASGDHPLRRDQARARGRLQLEGRARRRAALARTVRQPVLAGAGGLRRPQ